MNEQEFREWLTEVLIEHADNYPDEEAHVSSFAEEDLMTNNEGLVVTMPHGQGEFQLTIHKTE